MSDLISIIPKPAKLNQTGRNLRLSGVVPLHLRGQFKTDELADLTIELVKEASGLLLARSDAHSPSNSAPGLTLSLVDDKSTADDGAYSLSVNERGVIIAAGTESSIFYGVQSLLQLLPISSPTGETLIPGVKISDRPRFTWRGMHLDVSRHFFPVSFVKKYIDLLAWHKMNIFHWHLVDDQGWRLEIKKYPRLTEIGSRRTEADGSSYGGFYTQTEIREIVEYARQRYVTIVPEIEMPGHAVAALAAYPEFSCTGEQPAVETHWGVFDEVFCAGNERTFEFLENVLDEVIALFPSPFIHIGGDECPKTRWHEHDLCQNRMRQLGLENEDQLQAYFTTRIGKYLDSRGKRLVGWDEILDGGISSQSVIMAWRGVEKGIQAANAGHEVIMSPMSHCYFDHYQAKGNEPHAIGGFTPLERVYDFEPIPPEMDAVMAKQVLGAQGNVWTEYMPNSQHVEYMVFPRLCAMAEVLWSSRDQRSLADFVSRLRSHLKRLDRLGVNYRPLDDQLL